jgi:hypothetical protein
MMAVLMEHKTFEHKLTPTARLAPTAFMVPAKLLPPTPEQVRERALEEVNALRTEWGLPAIAALPPGRQGDPKDCCLRRAFGSAVETVGKHHIQFTLGPSIAMSANLQWFVRNFDRGRYPDLIDPSPAGEEIKL